MAIILILEFLLITTCVLPFIIVLVTGYALEWMDQAQFGQIFLGNMFFWGILLVLGFFMVRIYQNASTVRRLLMRTYPAEPEIIQLTNAFKQARIKLWRTFYITNIVFIPLAMILYALTNPEMPVQPTSYLTLLLIPILGPIGYGLTISIFNRIQEMHLEKMRLHIDRINKVKNPSDFKLPVLGS